ncbi:MAG TPA: hypothetical protein VFI70_13410 [Nitrososphaeraceae archaeon]|nr:hypothetical protein [Nitrososphaeraceae archaeon]
MFNDTLLLAFQRKCKLDLQSKCLAVKINEVGDSKLPFIAIISESVPIDGGGNWYRRPL